MSHISNFSIEEAQHKSIQSILEKIDQQEENIKHKKDLIENGITCDICKIQNVLLREVRVLHNSKHVECVVCRSCGFDLRDAGYGSAPYREIRFTGLEDSKNELDRLLLVEKFIRELHESGKLPIFACEDICDTI